MAEATINVPVSIDLSTIQRWMESSDIVEVVRCKDCKYNYANMIPDGKGCQQNVYIEVDDNFFCADGEREMTEDDV